jgi:hypothetical protein
MAKKVVLMTIHGMGDTDADYFQKLKKRVKKELDTDWDEVAFGSVYFQPLLQDNQEAYFARVRSRLDYRKFRKFILYGFSDAGGLEYSRTLPDSIYKEVQRTIFDALGDVWNNIDPAASVVFIAQSLGGQVLSNYIWDAAKYGTISYGIWGEDHSALPQDELAFRQLKSLDVLMTTGCNIPIFVAGLKRANIKPIAKPNPDFVWENYFDEDDILGWPLQDLSDEYDALVEDKEINAGGFLTSWTPLSHTKYWKDKDVINPLAEHLRRLM